MPDMNLIQQPQLCSCPHKFNYSHEQCTALYMLPVMHNMHDVLGFMNSRLATPARTVLAQEHTMPSACWYHNIIIGSKPKACTVGPSPGTPAAKRLGLSLDGTEFCGTHLASLQNTPGHARTRRHTRYNATHQPHTHQNPHPCTSKNTNTPYTHRCKGSTDAHACTIHTPYHWNIKDTQVSGA